MPIPYAPQRIYQPDSTIIGLIQQAGHDAAQGQRLGGSIWANAARDVGGIAAGTIQDIAAGKAQAAQEQRKEQIEAPRLAQEAEARALDIETKKATLAKQARESAEAGRVTEALSKTRQEALDMFSNDPVRFKQVSEHFKAKDDLQNRLYAQSAKAIRGFGDDPRAALMEIQDLEDSGYDPKKLALVRDQIQADPKAVSAFVDSLLLKSPDAEDHKLVKAPGKLEDQLAEAIRKGDEAGARAIERTIQRVSAAGRAPAAPKDPVYREIEGKTYLMQGGKAVPVAVPVGSAPATASPAEAPFIAQPAFQKLAPPAKTQVVKAAELINTAKRYRDLVLDNVDDSGLLLSGSKAADINSRHGNLIFKGAGGYGQGALQAPDKEVMEQIFPNPASLDWKSMAKTKIRGGKVGVKAALDSAISQLQEDLFSVYGLRIEDPSTAPLEVGTTVPPPGDWAPTSVPGFSIRPKR